MVGLLVPPPKQFHIKKPWVLGRFVGRKDYLSYIHSNTQKYDQCNIVISGTAGSGKSSLAHAYSTIVRYSVFDNKIFLRGDSPDSLINDLCELLNIELQKIDAGRKEATNYTRASMLTPIFNEIFGGRKTLLIIDNVDEIKTRDFLVKSSLANIESNLLLITSQLQDGWPIETYRVKKLLPFSEDEAVEYIAMSLDVDINEPEKTIELAKELGYLPLALVLACSYILKRRLTIHEYIIIWNKQKSKILLYTTNSISYPKSLEMAWDLVRHQLSDEANVLSYIIAAFSSDFIPTIIFKKNPSTKKQWNEQLIHMFGVSYDDSNVDESLEELSDYSLIEWERKTVKMHQVIQKVISEADQKMSKSPIRYGLHAASCLLADSLPSPYDTSKVGLWKELEPHLLKICKIPFPDTPIGIHSSFICNEFGEWYSDQGNFGRAIEIMLKSIAHEEIGIELNIWSYTSRTACRYYNAGEIYMRMGKFSDSLPYTEKSLKIYQDVSGTTHEDVAKALHSLGKVSAGLNNKEKAYSYVSESIDIYSNIFGRYSNNLICPLLTLSSLLMKFLYGQSHHISAVLSGSLENAEEPFNRIIEIIKRMDKKDQNTVEVALAYGNYGYLKWLQGKRTEGKKLMEKAYFLEKSLHGTNHPMTTCRLGTLIYYSGSYSHLTDDFLKQYERIKSSIINYDPDLDFIANLIQKRRKMNPR